MHQNIYVLRTSKLKTRPGRFDSSEIGWRIVFHAGRSLLGVQLHTLRERSRKVGRKKRQRYSNEFRRNAFERMNAYNKREADSPKLLETLESDDKGRNHWNEGSCLQSRCSPS